MNPREILVKDSQGNSSVNKVLAGKIEGSPKSTLKNSMFDGTVGRQKQVLSGAGWPANLAELMTYRPVRDPTSKNKRKQTNKQTRWEPGGWISE